MGPLWVDAQTIDVADHVATAPVPAPGDETQLLLTLEQLRRRRLDRSRPLWEMWFLTGLPGEPGWPLYPDASRHGRRHGGFPAWKGFSIPKADMLADPPTPWTPVPMPTDSDLLRDKRGQQRLQYHDALTAIRQGLVPDI